MIKIALASNDESKAREVIKYLSADYDIIDREDCIKDSQFLSVMTLNNSKAEEIKKMLSLIESATGINPALNDGRKNRQMLKARTAASYILRYRYGLSYVKCGKILNCNHVTVFLRLRKIKHHPSIKLVPIEIAVRRALILYE